MIPRVERAIEVWPVTWWNRGSAPGLRKLGRRDAEASGSTWQGQAEHDGRASQPVEQGAPEFAAATLQHAGALYRTAYHLAGNSQDAEDLTQETYLRAYRGYSGFRGGDIRAWLFTILRHAFLDDCRRRGRMPVIAAATDDALSLAALTVGAWSPSAEAEALRRLPSEELDRAFTALPPDWRMVVLLADVEELSYREIAGIMDIPIGTVMSRLHRAHKRLQEHLLVSRPPGRQQQERSA
jgi:RNA polymerase sigma-70 factor (ECF subfamily)